MEEAVDNILCALLLTEEEKKDYKKVKKGFDVHCTGKIIVIHEQDKFNEIQGTR